MWSVYRRSILWLVTRTMYVWQFGQILCSGVSRIRKGSEGVDVAGGASAMSVADFSVARPIPLGRFRRGAITHPSASVPPRMSAMPLLTARVNAFVVAACSRHPMSLWGGDSERRAVPSAST